MPSNKKDRKPTMMEESLIQAMLIEGNQRKALIASDYATDNMKPSTLDNTAYKILNRPHVKARYEELHKKVRQKAEDKAIFTVEGLLNDLKALIDRNKKNDDKLALDGIKVGMKHMGMLKEKLEVNGTLDINHKSKLVDKYLDGDQD